MPHQPVADKRINPRLLQARRELVSKHFRSRRTQESDLHRESNEFHANSIAIDGALSRRGCGRPRACPLWSELAAIGAAAR